MQKSENCVLVIFGASGDLTKRKLIPALFSLHRRDLLPDGFGVLGIGRTSFDDESFRGKLAGSLRESVRNQGGSVQDVTARDIAARDIAGRDIAAFTRHLYYQPLDTTDPERYGPIVSKLAEIDEQQRTAGRHLFYLATPPNLYETVVSGLGHHGLNRPETSAGWRRLIVEKPFGYDLESGRRLDRSLHAVFEENQIFRIDHYLGKETVQNVLVFRFGNGIYEPLWNRNYVDRVEITAAEALGVEARGGYYERAGALRDMFQNHLLNLVGMVAMEPPSSFNARSVRNETVKVFEALKPMAMEDVERFVVRGQYMGSKVRGQAVRGYREEEAVAGTSKTETYVAVKLFIDNWRWAGVPFFVRTGKRLPTRVTEVVIHFRQTPHRLFGARDADCFGCNQLVMRIQPDEGILLRFNMKLPGSGFETKTVSMDFHYADLADIYAPEAYERLLLDCMVGDATLYARSDAVEACWEFVDPMLRAWAENPRVKLYGYAAGTWGPRQARDLFPESEMDWRHPCRNLADEGAMCEL